MYLVMLDYCYVPCPPEILGVFATEKLAKQAVDQVKQELMDRSGGLVWLDRCVTVRIQEVSNGYITMPQENES